MTQKHFHKNFVPKNRFKESLGRFVFWLMGGWKLVGEIPKVNKCVIIAAHHTSNWDFIIGIATKLILRLNVRYFAKDSLFIPPLGWLVKGLGGIAIKRNKSINRVDQQAQTIRDADNFLLAIAPEGTRSKVDRWKTGFYHIARKADVPIVLCAFDFENKQVVFGKAMIMSGDQEKDFEDMHRFFLPYKPKHPELSCNGPFARKKGAL